MLFFKLKRIPNFLNEVKLELKRTSWSSRPELIGATVIVIVTTFLLAFFVGIWDFFLARLISLILK